MQNSTGERRPCAPPYAAAAPDQPPPSTGNTIRTSAPPSAERPVSTRPPPAARRLGCVGPNLKRSAVGGAAGIVFGVTRESIQFVIAHFYFHDRGGKSVRFGSRWKPV
jgi:hypothetical protein